MVGQHLKPSTSPDLPLKELFVKEMNSKKKRLPPLRKNKKSFISINTRITTNFLYFGSYFLNTHQTIKESLL